MSIDCIPVHRCKNCGIVVSTYNPDEGLCPGCSNPKDKYLQETEMVIRTFKEEGSDSTHD
jgi:Zn finger protein HypA/HybF involved in hydrogenase expression